MDTRKPIKSDNPKIKDAESYHQSFSFPDLVSYQKAFAYGQARINFELNQVDQDFVEALKMIFEALEKLKDLPQLQGINLTAICEKITDAETRSNKVASIRPPGCEGPYPA